MTGMKKCIKWLFDIFNKNSYYAQNWLGGAFFGPKMQKYTNLFFRFFQNLNDDKHSIGTRNYFFFFRATLIMPNETILWVFLITNLTLQLYSNLLIRFSKILPNVCHSRVGKSDDLIFLGQFLLLPKLEYFDQSDCMQIFWGKTLGNAFFNWL